MMAYDKPFIVDIILGIHHNNKRIILHATSLHASCWCATLQNTVLRLEHVHAARDSEGDWWPDCSEWGRGWCNRRAGYSRGGSPGQARRCTLSLIAFARSARGPRRQERAGFCRRGSSFLLVVTSRGCLGTRASKCLIYIVTFSYNIFIQRDINVTYRWHVIFYPFEIYDHLYTHKNM